MENKNHLRLSEMAETMLGSEIIKLAWNVNAKIEAGEKISNLTIGDYDPNIFPIPDELKEEIIRAYQNNITNYPPSEGIPSLRKAVSVFLKERGNLDYNEKEILISGGARPLIYAIYGVIVEPGEKVLFPIPSWNNNHYTHLFRCQEVVVTTKAENNFMPTADEIRPHISEVALICICSPLNPTGTCISRESLEEICDMILEENKKRVAANRKPLYLMYDQIYWLLSVGDTEHVEPVTLRPEMRDYTIFIHGASKIFAATGVRVGWTFGPEYIIGKMKNFLGHVGSWAPKAEQSATAVFLNNKTAVDKFLAEINEKINIRLKGFYSGFAKLKEEGFPIEVIAPQAAIYMTVKFDIIGKKKENGQVLASVADITSYLLDEAKVALVPFSAFGSPADTNWFRLSIGTCKVEDIDYVMKNVREALQKLS